MLGVKRWYEALLKEYLGYFPCVAVVGSRQCGKTTLLKTLSKPWKIYDLERQSDFQVVANDPELFLRLNPERIAIDEAQLLPELFAALRVAVDNDRSQPGRFVITGSSSPDLLGSISESLAGRVGIIEMSPFSFLETQSRMDSRFFALLGASAEAGDIVAELDVQSDVRAIHDYWFYGGYPEPWLRRHHGRFRNVWMDQYVRTYLHRDVAGLFPGLDHNKFRLFIQMLGGLSGTVINYADVARTLGVSQPTARDYFEIAHGTFVWRRLPAYEKNAMKRIVKHPKGFLRDSGLLHHLLRIPDCDALLAHPKMGASWEGLVIEEIIRGLTARGIAFDSFFYRTGAGAEVDLVLEGDFGLVPVEIKYASTPGNKLRGLKQFVEEYKCRVGIVVSNDDKPRLYNEKIAGVPFACL